MGYPLEIFQGQIDQWYICQVCHQVLQDPMMCSYCEALFCKTCISDICSSCKNVKSDFKVAMRAFTEVISKLQVKCRNPQCKFVTTLQYLEKHEKESCEFMQESCPNQGCKAVILKGQMEDHVKNCKHLQVECNKCQSQMLKIELNDHDCITSLKQQNKIIQQRLQQIEKQNQAIKDLQSQNQQVIEFLQKENNLMKKQIQLQEETINKIQNETKVNKSQSLSIINLVETQVTFDSKLTDESITLINNNKKAQWNEAGFETAFLSIQLTQKAQFKIKFKFEVGYCFIIGVCHQIKSMDCFTKHSTGWGFNNYNMKLEHNGETIKKYGERCQMGKTLEMIVDTKEGFLSYCINGKDYGVAFQNKSFCNGEHYIALSSGLVGDLIEIVQCQTLFYE